MLLVESHFIKESNPLFKECDNMCFLSKNLYNASLYAIRQQYELDKTYLNYHSLDKIFIRKNNHDYRNLPAKVSQQVMMLLDRNYKSYFKALKTYVKSPDKFRGLPQPPRFKHKTKGRNVVTYTNQAISKMEFKRTGFIRLSGTEIRFNTKIENYSSIQQVRIIPMKNKSYKIEVVYERKELAQKEDNGIYCGVDVGLNNLFAVTFNDKDKQNLLVNGRPLKAINQYYNKKKARLQGELEIKNNRKSSRQLNRLTQKRNNKINDYVHKSTRILVEQLKQDNVSHVVIGKNDGWKDEINIGKKNNQNFVSLPHAKAIDVFKYKLELEGIQVTLREESYTSKTSLIDMEPIKKHDEYLGKRIKRGLFRSENGTLLNADINGAGNILRKEIPTAFANGIEGLVVNPRMLFV